MTLFDRYLLREWLQIIGLVIAALLGLLLVNVLYTDLPPLLQADATLADVLVYLGVTIPSFLSLLLPLSLLVSILYVFGTMHKNHEFTAMRAAGVSLLRISMPIWLIGLICCGLSWWLNSGIVPWSTEKSRVLREQIEFRHQSNAQSADYIGAVYSVSFDNRKHGRMWFINRYSKFTQKAYGMTLSYMDAFRHEKRRLIAAQAWRNQDGKGWTLKGGRELIFEPTTGEVVKNQPFSELKCPELDEDADLMLLIDRKPIDLSFWELGRLIDHLEDTRSPKISAYAVRYQSLLADTLAPLIVIGLSIPFAVSGVRVNPAVGMSKSIGLFILYYLFAQLGGSLAAKGYLTPFEAAWLPSIAMVTLAGWLIARLR